MQYWYYFKAFNQIPYTYKAKFVLVLRFFYIKYLQENQAIDDSLKSNLVTQLKRK